MASSFLSYTEKSPIQLFLDGSTAWKEVKKRLMDNAKASKADKKLIQDLITALEHYEAALKKAVEEDEKKKKEHPLNPKKQSAEDFQIISGYKQILDAQAHNRQQLADNFRGLFNDLLNQLRLIDAKKPHIKDNIATELKLLTDSVTFATKVIAKEKMEEKDIQPFTEAGKTLDARIQKLNTTAERRVRWRTIGVILNVALMLALMATGVALAASGVGIIPAMVFFLAGFAVGAGIGFTVIGTTELYKSTLSKLSRHEKHRTAHKGAHALFKTPPPEPPSIKTKHHETKRTHSPKTKK